MSCAAWPLDRRLRGNQIGNDGANAFGRVLDNNLKLQSQLTVLDISKNQVSAATAFSMVSKMKHSETFKHFVRARCIN